MKSIFQSGLTLLAVACGLALFFAFRWFAQAAGVFTMAPVTPGPAGSSPSLPGPGDFEIDAAHNAILVAASDRRHPGRAGRHLSLKLDDPGAAPLKLAGTPADFHPHGISISIARRMAARP